MARAMVALVLLACAAVAYALTTQPTPTLPPCPTEDSVSCYWDGDSMGNGHGRSFTTDQHGNPTYTD